MRLFAIISAVLLILVAGCGKETPTSPTNPSGNGSGRIIYTAFNTSTFAPAEIKILDLTSGQSSRILYGALYTEPAGGRMIFGKADTVLIGTGDTVLYAASLDGSSQVQLPLPPTGLEIESGTLSSDGGTLVFATYDLSRTDYHQDGLLFVQRTDGSAPRQIASDIYFQSTPTFSPDGSRIAYASVDGFLYVMNADGSGRHAIARVDDEISPDKPHDVVKPAWSPAGDRIAISTPWLGTRIVAVNTTTIDSTWTESYGGFLPAWSHTGNRLALVTSLPGSITSPKDVEMLSYINVGGSGGRTVTTLEKRHRVVDTRWSPDDARLLYIDLSLDSFWPVGTLKLVGAESGSSSTISDNAINAYWLPN